MLILICALNLVGCNETSDMEADIKQIGYVDELEDAVFDYVNAEYEDVHDMERHGLLKIEEYDQLKDFISKCKSNNGNVCKKYFMKYNKSFFDNNTLFVSYFSVGSGSAKYEIQDVIFEDEKMAIEITRTDKSSIGTCDMSGWIVSVPVNNDKLNGITKFDLLVDYHEQAITKTIDEATYKMVIVEHKEHKNIFHDAITHMHMPEHNLCLDVSNPTWIIRDRKSLEDFVNTYKNEINFYSGYMGYKSFNEETDEYNDAFFNEKLLVISYSNGAYISYDWPIIIDSASNSLIISEPDENEDKEFEEQKNMAMNVIYSDYSHSLGNGIVIVELDKNAFEYLSEYEIVSSFGIETKSGFDLLQ